ncbi:ELMO domain-containing protein [Dioscorea alata]|uniref:ELMO domain-containing protein n=1 Tax=Dioscorea alata TaxID=55571 RepID=A0ACB7V1Y4_DIOAL|nr:ELMO domain-containing protein [Dioscorea alata]
MLSGNLRRRLHHGDLDGRRNEHVDTSGTDGLNEPLLGTYSYDEPTKEYGDTRQQDIWDDRKKEQLHWAQLFCNLVAQWGQWLANIIHNSGSVLGRMLPPISFSGQDNLSLLLSPLQEERLRNLKQRLGIPFDSARVDHQDALRQLWRLAYPGRQVPPLKSELWKEMGWQGSDPSTDFRGGGFVSLENLIFFAKTYPDSFQGLLHKRDGRRAEWEYPFAVAGINISFMLVQMLGLELAGRPSSKAGICFIKLLGEDEMAFDNLYCIAFQMMDAQWLAKRASYMEFNEVLKATRTQLERELSLDDVFSVRDLPAYNMLTR